MLRHQFFVTTERRKMSWLDYGTQVNSQFYSQALSNLWSWQETLKRLAQLKHLDFVSDVLSANNHRLSLFPSESFSRSHYIFQFDIVVIDLRDM